MKTEFPLFNNIVDSKYFKHLSTSEKIKLLLQKDIFFFETTYNKDGFYCQNFDKLDFSVFEKFLFGFYELYEIDNKSIKLNPLIQPEVFEGLCLEVKLCLDTSILMDEINFQLLLLKNRKEKVKYLREKIAETGFFDAYFLNFEFDKNTNEIFLSPIYYNEIILFNPRIVEKWVTGQYSPHNLFLHSEDYLIKFYSLYQKLLIVEFCFNEIILLNNPKDTESPATNTINLKTKNEELTNKDYSINISESNINEEVRNIEKHSHIFNKNAFEVWQSMFDSFGVNESSRTDVKFMFEEMKKDGLIFESVNQKTFLDWISKTYNILVQKTSNHSRTPERRSIYSTAKQLFKP